MDASTLFSVKASVRDYECDMQGVVNNAIYQNYLEWARHEYLKSRGLDFADLTKRGIIVVVVRAELDYLAPLRSSDTFTVTVSTRRTSRLRLVFDQEIRVQPHYNLALKAQITTTCVNERNRPYFHEDLARLL